MSKFAEFRAGAILGTEPSVFFSSPAPITDEILGGLWDNGV